MNFTSDKTFHGRHVGAKAMGTGNEFQTRLLVSSFSRGHENGKRNYEDVAAFEVKRNFTTKER